jgi:CRP-like cAMP-binding protein
VIEPLPTQQELATLIFSQRESVGRDMSRLKDAGLIERKGRTLRITSLSRLKALLDEG